jgi:protein-glutamine gamma-glutamyltransferase
VSFNRHIIVLGSVLLAMLYAGAAQQNGSAYLVAFLVASMVAVSWLHARRNLSAVEVTAGSVSHAEVGTVLAVPLRIVTKPGLWAYGIEVTSPDAVEPVFIQQLKPGEPHRATLRLRVDQSMDELRFLVRSYYPLGFFTMSRGLTQQLLLRVLPKAEGTLPLPTPSGEGAGAVVQRGGEDFHGVRPYQPGDSLKHVDWKALARGRPLVVKEYAGGAGTGVQLLWDQVQHLGHEAAVSQLAQWCQAAEAAGYGYSLSMPRGVIPTGRGEAHLLRCRQALSDLVASQHGLDGAGLADADVKPPPTRETSAEVPGRPLALMLGLYALLALPLIGWVHAASIGLFYLALLLRWKGRRWMLSLGVRLAVVGIGAAVAYFSFGSLVGVEPGMAILVTVIASKVMESRTARDFQIVAVLGWFLCLSILLLEQGLGRSVYALTLLLLLAAVVIRFRSGDASLWPPIRTAGKLALQGIPLVAVLFFLFPRNTSGLAVRLSRGMFATTALRENMDPASIQSLVKNSDTAFRANITHGSLPSSGSLYWRCMTLVSGSWFQWKRSEGYAVRKRGAGDRKAEIHQRIMVEPHYQKWLPALDYLARNLSHYGQHFLDDTDETLRAYEPVTSVRRYEVSSIMEQSVGSISGSQKDQCLVTPTQVPPKVRALAEQLRTGDAEQVIQQTLDWFRAGSFRYTLEPGVYAEDGSGMEDFLFTRRQGFCGHYAAAFGTLMRLAGVPTRLVQGYVGGEYVRSYDYYLIRQSDAHVWCEVWIEGKGWRRVDPTAELEPRRMAMDLESYLDETAGLQLSLLNRNAWYGQLWLQTQLAWDSLNYQWYEHVVQFDEDAQSALWANWGIDRLRLRSLALLATTALLLPLALLAWFIFRPQRLKDPSLRRWLQFCQRMRRQGLPRATTEGPLDYSTRIAKARPDLAAEATSEAQQYVEARYGSLSS